MQEWQLTPAGIAWAALTDTVAGECVGDDEQTLRSRFAPGFVFRFPGQPDADEDDAIYLIAKLQAGCYDWLQNLSIDEAKVVVSNGGLTITVPYTMEVNHDGTLQLPGGRPHPATDNCIKFEVTDTVTVIDEEEEPKITSWVQEFNAKEVFPQFESPTSA